MCLLWRLCSVLSLTLSWAILIPSAVWTQLLTGILGLSLLFTGKQNIILSAQRKCLEWICDTVPPQTEAGHGRAESRPCRAALWPSRSSCSWGFWWALSWWQGPEGELWHPGRPCTPRMVLPHRTECPAWAECTALVCAALPCPGPRWLLTGIYFSTWHIEH